MGIVCPESLTNRKGLLLWRKTGSRSAFSGLTILLPRKRKKITSARLRRKQKSGSRASPRITPGCPSPWLAALDYCDEAVKATESADNLRSQIKDYLEDSSQARMEAEEARREIEKLKKEVQTLRGRLEGQAAEPKKSVPVPGRTVAAPAPISRPAGQSRHYSQPEPEKKEKSKLDQEIMDFFQSGEAEE